MRLFDKILELFKSSKSDETDLPSFWDDDYCQIEIISNKNIKHIHESIRQIDEFDKNNRTPYGFKGVFIRKELPFSTLNEKLRIEKFEQLFIEKGFDKAKQILYNSNRINCSKKTPNAFSLPCFNFFYDVKGGIINNIWISTSLITSTDHFNTIKETLNELGINYGLVLINWNSSELIDLTDKNQIKEYLMGYWK